MAAPILGIMSRHVDRGSIEGVAAAVAEHGLGAVQLSLESAGLDPMPIAMEPAMARRISQSFQRVGVTIAAVSGTFNTIDPNLSMLRDNLERFRQLCGYCAELGTRVITGCSGTLDPRSMWRAHPENQSDVSWSRLIDTAGQMAVIAEACGIVVAFEPETANVLDTTSRARQLLDEIGSPALGITFDPANFFYPADLGRMRETIGRGFDDLAPHIALAHAKDVIAPPDHGSHCHYRPAGQGTLDYRYFLQRLAVSGYGGPLIMHSLQEADIEAAVAMIRECAE